MNGFQDTNTRISKEKTQAIFVMTLEILIAPFNNKRNLKFKTQPTNAFFSTVNPMFGGSSQLSTTADRPIIKSLCTCSSDNETVLGSSRKLGGPAEHLIDGSEKRIRWSTFEV